MSGRERCLQLEDKLAKRHNRFGKPAVSLTMFPQDEEGSSICPSCSQILHTITRVLSESRLSPCAFGRRVRIHLTTPLPKYEDGNKSFNLHQLRQEIREAQQRLVKPLQQLRPLGRRRP